MSGELQTDTTFLILSSSSVQEKESTSLHQCGSPQKPRILQVTGKGLPCCPNPLRFNHRNDDWKCPGYLLCLEESAKPFLFLFDFLMSLGHGPYYSWTSAIILSCLGHNLSSMLLKFQYYMTTLRHGKRSKLQIKARFYCAE